MILSVTPAGGDAFSKVTFGEIGTKRHMLKIAARYFAPVTGFCASCGIEMPGRVAVTA